MLLLGVSGVHGFRPHLRIGSITPLNGCGVGQLRLASIGVVGPG